MQITITVPTLGSMVGAWRWVALPVLALVLALAVGHDGAQRAAAHVGHAGLDFSMDVDVDGDTTGDCDTKAGGPGTKCTAVVGTTLTVRVDLNSYPSDLPGNVHLAFQARVVYPALLSLKQRSGASEVLCPYANPVSTESKPPGAYVGFCASDTGATSTFTGRVMEVDFNCDSAGSGTVTLDHEDGVLPVGETLLGDSDGNLHAESADESVTINCVFPEINIVTATAQVLLPGACYDVFYAPGPPVFNVCDNDIQGPDTLAGVCDVDGTPECEDSDPTPGSIRVAAIYPPGGAAVIQKKAPPNHPSNTTPVETVPCPSPKCEFTVKNASLVRPWHPWDLVGDPITGGPDGLVRVADILAVVNHYFDDKPLP